MSDGSYLNLVATTSSVRLTSIFSIASRLMLKVTAIRKNWRNWAYVSLYAQLRQFQEAFIMYQRKNVNILSRVFNIRYDLYDRAPGGRKGEGVVTHREGDQLGGGGMGERCMFPHRGVPQKPTLY